MIKLILLASLITFNAHAKLQVITTTSNLASLVKHIAGDTVEVNNLCLGVQDPHFLEAKPSYIFKLSKADLLISIGAGLEVGWLPLIIQGSRNPKVREGQVRHLVASEFIDLLDSNPVDTSRSQGDVHPEGNPHFMLAPSQSIKVGKAIMDRLVLIDVKNQSTYKNNFLTFKNQVLEKSKLWKHIKDKKIKVVSYHKTLSYFYEEFGIQNIDVLEPKPGIPPSASHIIGLINKMKKENVKKIIVENYFDETVAKRIQREIPGIIIEIVPVAVEGSKSVDDLFDLYSYLIKKIGA